MADNAYSFSFPGLKGGTIALKDFAGKTVLVVNTASQCGLTPQYAGLEALHRAKGGKGLVVLGVPSNDFGGQEPGSEAEVAQFCETNYHVSFPMTAKQKVRRMVMRREVLTLTTMATIAGSSWELQSVT